MDDAGSRPFALFDLRGRTAVVTGASSGLGAGLARALGAAGATVAIVARRHERLVALAEEVGGAAFACDLLDPTQVDALVPEVAERLGPPEILVNAAGAIAGVHPAEVEPVSRSCRPSS